MFLKENPILKQKLWDKIKKVLHPRASDASEPKFLVVFKGKPDFKSEIIDKINKVRQPRASEESEQEILGGFIKK